MTFHNSYVCRLKTLPSAFDNAFDTVISMITNKLLTGHPDFLRQSGICMLCCFSASQEKFKSAGGSGRGGGPKKQTSNEGTFKETAKMKGLLISNLNPPPDTTGGCSLQSCCWLPVRRDRSPACLNSLSGSCREQQCLP